MAPSALSILTAERCAESGDDPFEDEVQKDLKTCEVLGLKPPLASEAGVLNTDAQKRMFVNLATPQRRMRRKTLALEMADSPGQAGR